MQCIFVSLKRQECVSGLWGIGNGSLWKPRVAYTKLNWVLWYGSLRRPCSRKQTQKKKVFSKISDSQPKVVTGLQRRLLRWKVKHIKNGENRQCPQVRVHRPSSSTLLCLHWWHGNIRSIPQRLIVAVLWRILCLVAHLGISGFIFCRLCRTYRNSVKTIQYVATNIMKRCTSVHHDSHAGEAMQMIYRNWCYSLKRQTRTL